MAPNAQELPVPRLVEPTEEDLASLDEMLGVIPQEPSSIGSQVLGAVTQVPGVKELIAAPATPKPRTISKDELEMLDHMMGYGPTNPEYPQQIVSGMERFMVQTLAQGDPRRAKEYLTGRGYNVRTDKNSRMWVSRPGVKEEGVVDPTLAEVSLGDLMSLDNWANMGKEALMDINDSLDDVASAGFSVPAGTIGAATGPLAPVMVPLLSGMSEGALNVYLQSMASKMGVPWVQEAFNDAVFNGTLMGGVGSAIAAAPGVTRWMGKKVPIVGLGLEGIRKTAEAAGDVANYTFNIPSKLIKALGRRSRGKDQKYLSQPFFSGTDPGFDASGSIRTLARKYGFFADLDNYRKKPGVESRTLLDSTFNKMLALLGGEDVRMEKIPGVKTLERGSPNILGQKIARLVDRINRDLGRPTVPDDILADALREVEGTRTRPDVDKESLRTAITTLWDATKKSRGAAGMDLSALWENYSGWGRNVYEVASIFDNPIDKAARRELANAGRNYFKKVVGKHKWGKDLLEQQEYYSLLAEVADPIHETILKQNGDKLPSVFQQAMPEARLAGSSQGAKTYVLGPMNAMVETTGLVKPTAPDAHLARTLRGAMMSGEFEVPIGLLLKRDPIRTSIDAAATGASRVLDFLTDRSISPYPVNIRSVDDAISKPKVFAETTAQMIKSAVTLQTLKGVMGSEQLGQVIYDLAEDGKRAVSDELAPVVMDAIKKGEDMAAQVKDAISQSALVKDRFGLGSLLTSLQKQFPEVYLTDDKTPGTIVNNKKQIVLDPSEQLRLSNDLRWDDTLSRKERFIKRSALHKPEGEVLVDVTQGRTTRAGLPSNKALREYTDEQ